MTSPKTLHVTATGPDGTVYEGDIPAKTAPPVDPPPVVTPPGEWIPEGTNAVRLGGPTGKVYPLAAVNPTPATHPGGFAQAGWNGRATDELVLCRAPWSASGFNRFGSEMEVSAAGRVVQVVVGQAGGIRIPDAPGYVLAGNGLADEFLQTYGRQGVQVELIHVQPAAPDAGSKVLACYLMRGSVGSSAIPALTEAGITEYRTAFLQGTPLKLVDWRNAEPASALAQALVKPRAGGVRHLVSVGGKDGAVPATSAAALASGIRDAERLFTAGGVSQVDGWDVDIEAGSANVPATVMAGTQLAASRLDTWITSLVPPGGSPVATYLEIGKQLIANGLRKVRVGQQLYDTGQHVSQSDMLKQLDLAVRTLGDPRYVMLGMWCGSTATRQWTQAECIANYAAALKAFPGLAGAYLWTETGAEVGPLAKGLRAVEAKAA
jgi:hypothetical protein